MKKTLRNLLLALTLVVATVCAGLLGACGNDDKTEGGSDGNFVVTVLYPNGNPVDGTKDGTGGVNENQVFVQICHPTDDGRCLPLAVDTNGKATIKAADLAESLDNASEYHITVQGLPAGYTAEEVTYDVSSGKNAVTITLVAE